MLLSEIEKQSDNPDENVYEAKFQFNGQKEMIEFEFEGSLNEVLML
jgi:hypothetical protein